MARKKSASEEVDDIVGMSADELQKQLGSKIKRGVDFKDSDYKSISTGSIKLDWALGLPCLEGSMVEIFAPAGVGKTTLALSICSNAMAMDKDVFYFDLEFKLREAQIKMIKNFIRDKFNIIYPDTAEDCLNMMQKIVTDFPGCVIVLDSIGGLLPEVEDAQDYSNVGMAVVPRILHKLVRKITGIAARNKCLLIFLNHLTATMAMYGQKDTTHGGNAIKNRAAQRIQLAALAGDAIKVGDKKIGQNVRATIVKNNVNAPYIEVFFPIIYGKGIDSDSELMDFAQELGFVVKNGGWVNIPNDDGTEGKKMRPDEMKELLSSDLELRNKLISKINGIKG